MFKKVLFSIFYLLLFFSVAVFSHFFIIPKLNQYPFFLKHELQNNKNPQNIIIKKTEHIQVKENFSIQKTAEKVLPALVKVYFILPSRNKTLYNKHKLVYSGLIVSGDGAIVTALPPEKFSKAKIKIILRDGREFIPTKISPDNYNELLFLKIKADNLPVAPFGDSDKLEEGEKVVLAGYRPPNINLALRVITEFDHSFNKNNLEFLFSDKNADALVLDEKLPGNFQGSAGIDFQGNLVGLVKGNSERSFLIPLQNIKNKLADIFKEGEKSFQLGVYYLNIFPELQKTDSLPVANGALIYEPSGKTGLAILANSVGRKIGLHLNDIILEVNGEKITYENNLSQVLSRHHAGEKLLFKVLRNNKIITLTNKE